MIDCLTRLNDRLCWRLRVDTKHGTECFVDMEMIWLWSTCSHSTEPSWNHDSLRVMFICANQDHLYQLQSESLRDM